MQALGYIRVSTSEQADSGLSLEAQRRKIKASAELSDLQLVDVLEDAGASAKDLDRPAMADLLNRIASGQVDCVIISQLDRLTRSTKDLGGLLETLAAARRPDGGRGVDLISTKESLDTSTATGELIINILGAISQWERKIIAERTSAALQEKREQGRQTGGIAPFGYDFVDGVRVENPQEQAVMARIANLREEGNTWQAVADTLTDNGHTTRKGGALTRQGIFRIAKRNGIT